MNGESSVTFYPQGDGAMHVLLKNLVLGHERDPLPKLLTQLAAEHHLDPERTQWYECWLPQGWGHLLAFWRENRCVRVDWKPINPATAEAVVQGRVTKAVVA